MIKSLDTHIAFVAMRGPWRSEDVTCLTELYFQRVGFDRHWKYFLMISDSSGEILSSNWDSLQLFPLIVAKNLGDESRVSLSKSQEN